MAKLPTFRSEEEEAEFWAAHDLTEFDEDLEPADVRCVRPEQVITLRLSRADVEALRRAARRRGIGYTTLARMWLHERLELEAKGGAR